MKNTETLRNLISSGTFLHLPSVYDPLSARQVEQAGFEATYVGGYVSGASKAISEPLLTLTEQVNIASEVSNSVSIPVLADAGAGFGEPLHSMRTVKEFIRAGIAGIHIEDQFFPKRAHYHKYQVHAISTAVGPRSRHSENALNRNPERTGHGLTMRISRSSSSCMVGTISSSFSSSHA